MNTQEEDLLKTALLQLNNNKGCALSGSLLLSVLGISKRRSAHDIDIVTSDPKSFVPYPPHEWRKIEGIYAVDKYINLLAGVAMDVLESTEGIRIINGIPCASVYEMIFAKINYGFNQNIGKHRSDMRYLYAKNPILSLKIYAVMIYRYAKRYSIRNLQKYAFKAN